jgi:hypothetical protein
MKTTTVKTHNYQRHEADKGYTNRYLDMDLSSGTIAIEPIEGPIQT